MSLITVTDDTAQRFGSQSCVKVDVVVPGSPPPLIVLTVSRCGRKPTLKLIVLCFEENDELQADSNCFLVHKVKSRFAHLW